VRCEAGSWGAIGPVFAGGVGGRRGRMRVDLHADQPGGEDLYDLRGAGASPDKVTGTKDRGARGSGLSVRVGTAHVAQALGGTVT
jgi:hypothetical protein